MFQKVIELPTATIDWSSGSPEAVLVEGGQTNLKHGHDRVYVGRELFWLTQRSTEIGESGRVKIESKEWYLRGMSFAWGFGKEAL